MKKTKGARPHPITLRAPTDFRELRSRVEDMGLDIRMGSKHWKVADQNGRLVTTLSVTTTDWRSHLNAWLQIQRWWRTHPDEATALSQQWVERHAPKPPVFDEDYGYRQMEARRAAERALKRVDHLVPVGEPQYVGERLRTRWTHRVCERCAGELGVAALSVQGAMLGACCRCDAATRSAVYVRGNPDEWRCTPHAGR